MVVALVTVIVALPGFTDLTVTVPLLIVAVATLESLVLTLNVPPLTFLLTVNVPLFGYATVPLVESRVKVFVPLTTVAS